MAKTKTPKAVQLSVTQADTVKAIAEAFEKDDGKACGFVAPHISDPRRDDETFEERTARLNANKVKAIHGYRIRIPNNGSSWKKFRNPTEATFKTLKTLGLVIEHSHREYALTPRGEAFVKGEFVPEVGKPKPPKRIEYTVTPAQAVDEERRSRQSRINSAKADIFDSAQQFIDRYRKALDEAQVVVEALRVNDARLNAVYTREREYDDPISTKLLTALANAQRNTRHDIIVRSELRLAALLAVDALDEEDSGPNLNRTRWEYPDPE